MNPSAPVNPQGGLGQLVQQINPLNNPAQNSAFLRAGIAGPMGEFIGGGPGPEIVKGAPDPNVFNYNTVPYERPSPDVLGIPTLPYTQAFSTIGNFLSQIGHPLAGFFTPYGHQMLMNSINQGQNRSTLAPVNSVSPEQLMRLGLPPTKFPPGYPSPNPYGNSQAGQQQKGGRK